MIAAGGASTNQFIKLDFGAGQGQAGGPQGAQPLNKDVIETVSEVQKKVYELRETYEQKIDGLDDQFKDLQENLNTFFAQ